MMIIMERDGCSFRAWYFKKTRYCSAHINLLKKPLLFCLLNLERVGKPFISCKKCSRRSGTCGWGLACFIFFFSSISHRIVSEIYAHQLPNQYEILSLTYSCCLPRVIIHLLVLTAEERLVLNISSEEAAAFFFVFGVICLKTGLNWDL